ncbi:bifunctional ADP-dependent (S)-NAD(P)H-hydrate dehydratase/NAD(P)H-hydrate epimerase [Vibrio breoganii]|uniref:NAD(P)H-hydrate dehydratase n=1 Tax=Vibrio breoganii TaxID=553239 RepID=UPI000C836BB2|nr:NAD(P)H-hydrate dehydratase [Vibrio breoganii]PMG05349.1 bifunctional ADP-dependent (S)-NAD(P)H-hydrate dehydratase/NAD(P)H-hydrate epimerase [Vibrio breoganii]
MYRLYSPQQIKQSEPQAADLAGITLYQLMERAGHAAFERLQSMLPNAGRVLVCCGSGNNGGDGFVVARLALELGYEVDVFQPSYCESNTADSAQAKQQWLSHGKVISSNIDELEHYDLIVDGLLGTGLKGNVRDNLAKVINSLNQSKLPILSLDIPSGLHADTGKILGIAVKATTTVTFIGNKRGLVTGQSRDTVGELYLADLGVGSEFSSLETELACIFDKEQAHKRLPKRKHTSHKGQCGRTLLVGGHQGTSGAIIMAAQASCRVGAGLISVMTHQDTITPVLTRQPEVMAIAIDKASDAEMLVDAMNSATVIALGPGLGTDDWSKRLFEQGIAQLKPKVIDADGLNVLAQSASSYDLSQTILTPHPGEAARLLECSAQEIEQDRYAAVEKIQSKYQCVVLLKGAGTLICNGQMTYVITAGNSGMASGGMGDVLTGVIAGLLSQGLMPIDAACLGAWLHSTAADNIATQSGKIGMLATDLLPEIRSLINQC